MGPTEDRRELTDTRRELEAVRVSLDRKTRRYRIAAVVGAVVFAGLVSLVIVGTVLILKVDHATTEINARGKENSPILMNMQAILDKVDSVTSATARQAQDANTASLVAGLECFIAKTVRHSDPSLPLPVGCVP